MDLFLNGSDSAAKILNSTLVCPIYSKCKFCSFSLDLDPLFPTPKQQKVHCLFFTFGHVLKFYILLEIFLTPPYIRNNAFCVLVWPYFNPCLALITIYCFSFVYCLPTASGMTAGDCGGFDSFSAMVQC